MDALLALIDAVGQSGFSAIAFVMLWIDIREMRKEHNAEVKALSDALEKNTEVLNEIKGRLMYENNSD